MKMDDITKCSELDEVVQKLMQELRGGSQIDYELIKKNEEYNLFNKIRHELSVSEKYNVLLRGTKIVIPKKLRKSTIRLAHAGHQG